METQMVFKHVDKVRMEIYCKNPIHNYIIILIVERSLGKQPALFGEFRFVYDCVKNVKLKTVLDKYL